MPTVAFDMLGTFFALDKPRTRLVDLSAPGHALDLWFAQTLRDFFALSHAGGYAPVGQMLRASLPRAMATFELTVSHTDVDGVMAEFSRLDPAEGARRACEMFDDADWTIFAVTNGGYDSTVGLLEDSDLDHFFADVLSCDAIRVSKPNAQVYRWLADEAGEVPWLIAAHAWDVMGAARAGLDTAWVPQLEGTYLDSFEAPGFVAADLVSAAATILQQ